MDEFDEKCLISHRDLLHLTADFGILAKFETMLRSLLKLEEKHVESVQCFCFRSKNICIRSQNLSECKAYWGNAIFLQVNASILRENANFC